MPSPQYGTWRVAPSVARYPSDLKRKCMIMKTLTTKWLIAGAMGAGMLAFSVGANAAGNIGAAVSQPIQSQHLQLAAEDCGGVVKAAAMADDKMAKDTAMKDDKMADDKMAKDAAMKDDKMAKDVAMKDDKMAKDAKKHDKMAKADCADKKDTM